MPGQLPQVGDDVTALMAGSTPIANASDPSVQFDPSAIYQRYPALKQLGDVQIIDSRAKGMADGRQLEYYPADETDNPKPGKPTIEVFNPELKDHDYEDAIAADMLHGLKAADPTWGTLRNTFAQTITPSQKKVDQRTYSEDVKNGEKRSFDQWMQDNRVDAYLRGYLFPDKQDEWRKGGAYTDAQKKLLEQMRGHLTAAVGSDVTHLMGKERAPDFKTTAEKPSVMDLALATAKGVADGLNPLPLLKAIYEEAGTEVKSGVPFAAVPFSAPAKVLFRGMSESAIAQFQKAKAAFQAGNISEALGHTLAMALPVVGPQEASAAEEIGSGDPMTMAHGVGGAISGLLPFAAKYGAEVARTGSVLPSAAAVEAAPPIKFGLPPFMKNKNPVEAAAVEFGESRGVPIDAATATGSPVMRHAQRMAGANVGGAGTAEAARIAQGDNLARVGKELAAEANPPGPNITGQTVNPPVTVEQAGSAVRDALTKNIQRLHAEADKSYGHLRKIEDSITPTTVTQKIPMTDSSGVTKPEAVSMPIRMAVDVRTAKVGLQPIFDDLMREREMAPLMGGKGRAAVALKKLLEGPDYQKLSVVDAALGDLKALARGADMPELRTEGQSIAALAVKELDKQVRLAALKAGPDALAALDKGRAATRAKYATAEVLQQLHEEPVRVVRSLTANDDAAIVKLRSVAREAPDSLPLIGRAYLEDLMDTATERGGFQHADKLYADWQKLGPETKKLLFRNTRLISDLDNFFLLAKKIVETPNPSGTAYALNVVKAVAAIPNYAIAKALYSPRVVQLLTKGMKMSISGAAPVRASAAGVIARALADAQALPMAAENQRREGPPTTRR